MSLFSKKLFHYMKETAVCFIKNRYLACLVLDRGCQRAALHLLASNQIIKYYCLDNDFLPW